MSIIEITSLLCKIIGIQSEIIKRQSEALEVVNAYDAETDRLMEELEKNENILDKLFNRWGHQTVSSFIACRLF